MKAELSVSSDERGSLGARGPASAPAASPASGLRRVSLTHSHGDFTLNDRVYLTQRRNGAKTRSFLSLFASLRLRAFALIDLLIREIHEIRGPAFAVSSTCFHLIPLNSTSSRPAQPIPIVPNRAQSCYFAPRHNAIPASRLVKNRHLASPPSSKSVKASQSVFQSLSSGHGSSPNRYILWSTRPNTQQIVLSCLRPAPKPPCHPQFPSNLSVLFRQSEIRNPKSAIPLGST